jgi:hypothetical protein
MLFQNPLLLKCLGFSADTDFFSPKDKHGVILMVKIPPGSSLKADEAEV